MTTRSHGMQPVNLGQMALEVQRVVNGRTKTVLVPHVGGTVHNPDVILNAILESAR